jgi:hypothetical protein
VRWNSKCAPEKSCTPQTPAVPVARRHVIDIRWPEFFLAGTIGTPSTAAMSLEKWDFFNGNVNVTLFS